MNKRVFFLGNADIRRRAARFAVEECPDNWMVSFSEPAKRRIQEERYHAMVGDIAAQSEYAGKRWDDEDMKRILLSEFADEMRSAGTPIKIDDRMIPSEDGRRVIQLGIQSRRFSVREASAFIEFLFAWGADRGVVFRELSTPKTARSHA